MARVEEPGPPPQFPSFLQALGIAAIAYALANIVGALILLPQILSDVNRTGHLERPFDIPGVSIIANSVAFGTVILLTWKRSGLSARDAFPLKRVAPMSLATIALLLGGGIILADLVSTLLVHFFPPPDFVTDLFTNLLGADAPLIRSFAFLVIVAPVSEELFFRGILQQCFRRRYGSRRAILYSATLFGLIHLLPWQMVPAFLLGLLFAWWVESTGSLWPSLAAHAITNGTTFVWSRLHPNPDPLAPEWPAPITLVAAVAALALGGLLARRFLPPAPVPAPLLAERSLS